MKILNSIVLASLLAVPTAVLSFSSPANAGIYCIQTGPNSQHCERETSQLAAKCQATGERVICGLNDVAACQAANENTLLFTQAHRDLYCTKAYVANQAFQTGNFNLYDAYIGCAIGRSSCSQVANYIQQACNSGYGNGYCLWAAEYRR